MLFGQKDGAMSEFNICAFNFYFYWSASGMHVQIICSPGANFELTQGLCLLRNRFSSEGMRCHRNKTFKTPYIREKYIFHISNGLLFQVVVLIILN